MRHDAAALLLALTLVSSARAAECEGLPALDVKTAPGLCVGVVAADLGVPRSVVELQNGDLLVTDMGGWKENAGRVLLLQRQGRRFVSRVLLTRLDRPHDIVIGPDGKAYVGVASGVMRFDPRAPKNTLTWIVGGDSGMPSLPSTGRHPLKALVFDQRGDLYVNVGSASDNCDDQKRENETGAPTCAEAEGDDPRGSIRKYTMAWPAGQATRHEIYARGLRNSMALAIHPVTGELFQAENARDYIHRRIPGMTSDEDSPHEELNGIERGRHYGWPYCYDDGVAAPEFPRADCARHAKPLMLLPAHAAPLGMTFYRGALITSAPQRLHLVIAYHGYRAHGHRIVAIPFDDRGVPSGPPVDLLSGWDATDKQPMGAPVDLIVAKDGGLYVAEDRNGRVLRFGFKRR